MAVKVRDEDGMRWMLERVTVSTPTAAAAQKRLFEIWQNTPLAQGIQESVEEFAGVFTAAETSAQVKKQWERIVRG